MWSFLNRHVTFYSQKLVQDKIKYWKFILRRTAHEIHLHGLLSSGWGRVKFPVYLKLQLIYYLCVSGGVQLKNKFSSGLSVTFPNAFMYLSLQHCFHFLLSSLPSRNNFSFGHLFAVRCTLVSLEASISFPKTLYTCAEVWIWIQALQNCHHHHLNIYERKKHFKFHFCV